MIKLKFIPIEPVFTIGDFSLTIYGLFYFISLLFFLTYIRAILIKIKEDAGLSYGIVFYSVLGMIIGSRIFYVIFYGLSYFTTNPMEIFFIWNGGLSSHGGIIGIIIGNVVFLWKNKKLELFLSLADKLVVPVAFILAFGRIVNFLNGDLLGVESNILWCVKSKINDICRHPIQIYEAIKNLSLFIILNIIGKIRLKKGAIFLMFIFLYSSLRIITDYFRVYETNLLGLGTGQYLNIFFSLISGIMLIKIYSK